MAEHNFYSCLFVTSELIGGPSQQKSLKKQVERRGYINTREHGSTDKTKYRCARQPYAWKAIFPASQRKPLGGGRAGTVTRRMSATSQQQGQIFCCTESGMYSLVLHNWGLHIYTSMSCFYILALKWENNRNTLIVLAIWHVVCFTAWSPSLWCTDGCVGDDWLPMYHFT